MAVDILIENGSVFCPASGTVRGDCVAIAGSTIRAVGRREDVASLAGPGTLRIDAEGGTVMPGFCDAHVHLFGGGAELDALPLGGVSGAEALEAAASAHAAARRELALVYGVGAAYDMLGPDRPITRHALDAVIADRPFAVMAADHHTVWANTAALEAAGLFHGADTPPGSHVVMDENGRATGELLESGAFAPILAMTPHGGRDLAGYVTGEDPSPAPDPAERAADREAIRRGLRHAAENGITTLHNMDGNIYQCELLSELEAAGDLIVRVQVPCHMKPHHPLSRLEEAEEMRRRWHSDRLWSGRVKMFMDGVMEAYTAFMLEPYPARPETRGEALFEAEQWDALCIAADAMGLQISVHAIGDAAVRRTLDGLAAARQANGPRDSRHRIEHIEALHPDDLPRFGELGVIASMQPLHSPRGGLFPVPAPGTILRADQLPLAFAWRALREHAARLVFSTDWPVAPMPVMPSVAAAVLGRDLGPAWGSQSLPLAEVLRACTADAAWAEFAEERKGRLAPGFLADIVVMSHALTALEPEALAAAFPILTICGGRITHRA